MATLSVVQRSKAKPNLIRRATKSATVTNLTATKVSAKPPPPPPPRPSIVPSKAKRSGIKDIELGCRIRLRRIEQGLSQNELARTLGVSFQQIQKYEMGRNRITANRLVQIAEALQTPMAFFYGDGGGDDGTKEVESLLFIDSSFSLRLLRAYSSLKNQSLQHQFVTMIESIVASQTMIPDE